MQNHKYFSIKLDCGIEGAHIHKNMYGKFVQALRFFLLYVNQQTFLHIFRNKAYVKAFKMCDDVQ